MPSGICSRRASFAGTITPVGSLVGGGSLPAADGIKLAAPRLHAGFSPALRRATPLRPCYGMDVLRAAFLEGMRGEPIWSLQSMPQLHGGIRGAAWAGYPLELHGACAAAPVSSDMNVRRLIRTPIAMAGSVDGISRPTASRS